MINTIFYFPASKQEYLLNEYDISKNTLSFIEETGEIFKDHVQYGAVEQNISKASIGLENVTNDALVKRSEMGVANGVATLGMDGRVPLSQLPSNIGQSSGGNDEDAITREEIDLMIRGIISDYEDTPASTGTSGTYPYNGMGKIVLKKNMIDGVNTLTLTMISAANTIYVVKYDFTISEDIIMPENCILEFDGGSINGNYILFGKMTIVKGYRNSGTSLWSGEFVTEDGRHISNHYKIALKNNIRLSCPWGYFGTDKNMDDRMIFQRMLGYDYYHLVLNLDVNVDANGIPTSIIWKSKDFSVTYDNTSDVAAALVNCINSNKLGVFDGFKIHTENTNIDTILRGSETNKIIAFLDLYKEGILTILNTLGNRCSQIKNFFILNEEPELMCTASRNSDVYNCLLDIKNTIKTYCTNANISISACDKGSIGFAWRTYCYTPQMISLVDIPGVNFYLSNISLLGNDTKLDLMTITNAVDRNKNSMDYYLAGISDFCITETGCSNKEASLARGAYWRQDNTDSMEHPLEAPYIYFVVFFKMASLYIERIKFIAHWFLNPYYFENGILKDFYGNVYQDDSYAYKLINEFKTNFYE